MATGCHVKPLSKVGDFPGAMVKRRLPSPHLSGRTIVCTAGFKLRESAESLRFLDLFEFRDQK